MANNIFHIRIRFWKTNNYENKPLKTKNERRQERKEKKMGEILKMKKLTLEVDFLKFCLSIMLFFSALSYPIAILFATIGRHPWYEFLPIVTTINLTIINLAMIAITSFILLLEHYQKKR